jgi:hypothetical protein
MGGGNLHISGIYFLILPVQFWHRAYRLAHYCRAFNISPNQGESITTVDLGSENRLINIKKFEFSHNISSLVERELVNLAEWSSSASTQKL